MVSSSNTELIAFGYMMQTIHNRLLNNKFSDEELLKLRLFFNFYTQNSLEHSKQAVTIWKTKLAYAESFTSALNYNIRFFEEWE